MESNLVNSIVTVLMAIVGVAIIAVLVSNNANTANVLTTGGQSFSQALGTAISPVTGSNDFGTGLATGLGYGGATEPYALG